MKILEDILTFINSLGLVDIIFFAAIIALFILLVTLVYFVKINKDALTEEDLFKGLTDEEDKTKEEVKKEVKNDVSVEEIKINPEYEEEEEGELLDLKTLTERLESEKIKPISVTEYEKDQEEKAIISYDELLKKKNKYAVNYEKEEVLDDLVVKKVDLNDLVNKDEKDEIKGVRVISYEKEEAFLNALKELNKLLN